MGYFPFFVDLSGQNGLIVGGGPVAARKVEKLLPYGPRLTVVAPRFTPELSDCPALCLRQRDFCPEDLTGQFFVVAATDSPVQNHQISALCQQRGIPVNVVDDKEACTFLFPALVKRGDLSIGISTSGSSPTAAIWLKQQIEGLLPQSLDEILAWLEAQRPLVKARCPQEQTRAALFAQLFTACLMADRPLTQAEFARILEGGGSK